ncbi:CPBP family intramembrane glutamic endopeptidase [Microbacterium resistens]
MTVPSPQRLGAAVRESAAWSWFLVLYALLTVWILVGRDIVAEPVFTGVKNGGDAVVMLFGAWVFRDAFARSWRVTRQRPLRAVGAALVGVVLMGVASALSQLATVLAATSVAGQNQAAISSELLVAATTVAGGIVFVGIGGVMAPVVEELAFRELPFTRLRGFLSTRTAFVLTSVVFAAVHLRSAQEWPLGILYVGFSAALATAYLMSHRNLLVSVAVHVLWNGTGLTYLLIAT